MTFEPGARLGAYEILAAIGAGGMGEVYRARDPRLGRDIAIKVLPVEPDEREGSSPGSAASRPRLKDERRARFDREARAVAALNHPNIVTIHAVEEAGGVPFFTMEYVEGRTLRDLVPERGLPLDELLKIAIPVTEAVGAAHQRGILHRDLKPANVMVTADGRVKVLDFGLAKLKETLEFSADGSQTTMEATGEGRIVGTVAYMSPEQAQGKPLDARSDIFSLGVLLYEMATGQRPFQGDTSVSVISAILKDTPSSVTDLRPELPRDLARIVKRALNKDPEHRYQTAKDLRNDLETLKEDLDSGELQPHPAQPTAPPARAWPWWAWGAGVVAAGALIAVSMLWLQTAKGPPAASVARPFDDITLTPLTSDGSAGLAVALSPDGRYVAHAFIEQGLQGVRVRQVDATAAVQVVPPADVTVSGVAFTPDGSRLYYLTYPRGSGQASLYEVPVLGGAPRKLLDDVDREVSFAPDGARFAFVRGVPPKSSAILIANADGTGDRTLAERFNPEQFALTGPAWSPDGRVIAAAAYTGRPPRAGLFAVNAESGAAQPIGSRQWDSVTSIRWMPDGATLLLTAVDYSISGVPQIWVVDYPAGSARRVTNDLAGYSRLGLSADGRVLAAIRSESRGSLWVGPAGQPEKSAQVAAVPSTLAPIRIDWTADGRILFTAVAGNNPDVWITRPDGTEARQLTTAPGLDGYPWASPDNKYVVFMSNRDGKVRVWRMDLDGSRQSPLTEGPLDASPVVSADGTVVYYTRADLPEQPLYRVPIAGGTPALVPSTLPGGMSLHSLSPDGMFLLGWWWDQAETRTREVIVRADGSGDPRKLDVSISLSLYQSFAWAPDGRALTFLKMTGGVPNLWRQPIDGGAATQVTRFTGGEPITVHAWSRDGKYLAMVRSTTTRDVVVIRDVRR